MEPITITVAAFAIGVPAVVKGKQRRAFLATLSPQERALATDPKHLREGCEHRWHETCRMCKPYIPRDYRELSTQRPQRPARSKGPDGDERPQRPDWCSHCKSVSLRWIESSRTWKCSACLRFVAEDGGDESDTARLRDAYITGGIDSGVFTRYTERVMEGLALHDCITQDANLFDDEGLEGFREAIGSLADLAPTVADRKRELSRKLLPSGTPIDANGRPMQPKWSSAAGNQSRRAIKAGTCPWDCEVSGHLYQGARSDCIACHRSWNLDHPDDPIPELSCGCTELSVNSECRHVRPCDHDWIGTVASRKESCAHCGAQRIRESDGRVMWQRDATGVTQHSVDPESETPCRSCGCHKKHHGPALGHEWHRPPQPGSHGLSGAQYPTFRVPSHACAQRREQRVTSEILKAKMDSLTHWRL